MKKVLAILGAAAAGFTAGVLTAPKSGKETRADLKKKTCALKKEAEKKVEQAAAAAKDGVDSLKTGSQKVGDALAKTAKGVKGSVEK